MSIMPAQCTPPSLPGSGPVSSVGVGQTSGSLSTLGRAHFGGSVAQSGL